MAYCVNSDVTAEFKNLSTAAGSAVTTAKIDEWISQADAFIDSKVGLKYSVPITNATDLLIMKQISTYLVAHRVKEILEVQTGADKADQRPGKTMRQMALDMLADIIKGDMRLINSTPINSTNAIESYTDDEAYENTFTRETESW